MSHVDEGLLHAYLDGALVPGDEAYAAIREHLARCADCRVRLEEARVLRDRAAEALLAVSLDEIPVPPFDAIVERSRGGAARRGVVVGRLPVRARRVRFVHAAWAASVALAVAAGWAAHGWLGGEGGLGSAERGASLGPASDARFAEGDVARPPAGGDPTSGAGAERLAAAPEDGRGADAAGDLAARGGTPLDLGADDRKPTAVAVDISPTRLAPPAPAPHHAGRPALEPEPSVEFPAAGPPPAGRLVLADDPDLGRARALVGTPAGDAAGDPALAAQAGGTEPGVATGRGLFPVPATGRGAGTPRVDPGTRVVGGARVMGRPAGGVAIAPSPGRVTGAAPGGATGDRRSTLDRVQGREELAGPVVAWLRITAAEAEAWLGEPPLRVTTLPAPEEFAVSAVPGGPVRSVQRLPGGAALELIQWRAGEPAMPHGRALGPVVRSRGWPNPLGIGAPRTNRSAPPTRADTATDGTGPVRVLGAATGEDGIAVVIGEIRQSGARLRLAAPVPLPELLELVPYVGPPSP
ncbi:MAG TPA: zf-HC2 domain-containing protein [Longimicrobiales bacterium]|nr:zf-HC2 domain-containing protein [Longimicrobiales bacterium]